MSAPSTLRSIGRIPLDLRVGVTGHRWIPSHDREAAHVVKAALQSLVQAANTPTVHTAVGCTVISSLAEGADRIVAVVGLDLGARLEVVLPLPQDDYETDFTSDESRREFRSLIQRAATVQVMDEAASRPDCYRAAGEAVADRGDVLLALWDGQPAAGQGGTAEIVDYARRLELPTLVLKASRGDPIRLLSEKPDELNVGPLTAAAFGRLDRYNRARLGPKERHAASVRLQDAEHVGWLPYYLRADLLAIRYQRLHRLTSVLLYVLAVSAVGVAALAPFDVGSSPAFIEVGLLFLLVLALIGARRVDALGRWTAARFVAERLRAAMFLADVGATPSFTLEPGGTSDVWVRADWASRAMRELWYRTLSERRPITAESAIRRIRDGWILPQLAYHQKALSKARLRQRFAVNSAIVLFVISIVAATLHGLGPGFLHESGTQWMEYLSIVVPTVGAAITGYAAQREYAREVMRSRHAIRELESVSRALATADSERSIQVVAAQIDALVHSDEVAWFVTANLHEPELP